MLNILHFISGDAHESVKRYVFEISEFFMRCGINMILLYIPGQDKNADAEFVSACQFIDMMTIPLNSKQKPVFPVALTLRALCEQLEIDVVHTHGSAAFLIACFMEFIGSGAVHIHTVHSVSNRRGESNFTNKLLSLCCDERIVLDELTKQAFMKQNVEKLRTAKNHTEFDFEAMIAGVYNVYVRGLRV